MEYKKIVSFILIILLTCSLSCCGDTKIIDGIEYDTYGLISEDMDKNPNIEYKPIWGNIIWGSILCETIIAPIYFFGFSMFEPVGSKQSTKQKGVII